jgi:hypothetical protein
MINLLIVAITLWVKLRFKISNNVIAITMIQVRLDNDLYYPCPIIKPSTNAIRLDDNNQRRP